MKLKQAILMVAAGTLSLSIAAVVFAQAQQHGMPTPEKVYGNGLTWPIKIKVWKYDKQQLLAQPAMSEEARTGRILWTQKCAYCHDGVGSPTYRTMGPWLGAEIVKNLGDESVRSFIKNGDVRMPAFRYNLSDQQIESLIAFLKTVPSDQRPTPSQLAGRGEAGAASD